MSRPTAERLHEIATTSIKTQAEIELLAEVGALGEERDRLRKALDQIENSVCPECTSDRIAREALDPPQPGDLTPLAEMQMERDSARVERDYFERQCERRTRLLKRTIDHLEYDGDPDPVPAQLLEDIRAELGGK